ncbi:MAG: ribosome silencing factor [Flavobacteriales bacterium]
MSKNTNDQLLSKIIEAIEEVKGENITLLDLREIDTAVCDYFVITEGKTNTQVSAIARSIEKMVGKDLKEKPWHIEGKEQAEWVLADYVSIVVHVFQKHIREHYDIEGLWGDAKMIKMASSANN